MASYSVPHYSYNVFKAAVNGRWFDLDGYYGAQCWDGIQLLYTQGDINQNFLTGNRQAKGCWLNPYSRAVNGSGHFRQITDKRLLKKGDIIVFNTYPGWYGEAGHVGYADEDYNGTDTIRILSQNFGTGSNPYTGKAFNVLDAYLGSAFLGAFRYDAWDSPVPPTPSEDEQRHFPWAVAWAHWDWQ